MKEWLIVIAVIAVVFVVFFVVLRSPASAQDGKVAGSWLGGVLQTKSSSGLADVAAPGGGTYGGGGTGGVLGIGEYL